MLTETVSETNFRTWTTPSESFFLSSYMYIKQYLKPALDLALIFVRDSSDVHLNSLTFFVSLTDA